MLAPSYCVIIIFCICFVIPLVSRGEHRVARSFAFRMLAPVILSTAAANGTSDRIANTLSYDDELYILLFSAATGYEKNAIMFVLIVVTITKLLSTTK